MAPAAAVAAGAEEVACSPNPAAPCTPLAATAVLRRSHPPAAAAVNVLRSIAISAAGGGRPLFQLPESGTRNGLSSVESVKRIECQLTPRPTAKHCFSNAAAMRTSPWLAQPCRAAVAQDLQRHLATGLQPARVLPVRWAARRPGVGTTHAWSFLAVGGRPPLPPVPQTLCSYACCLRRSVIWGSSSFTSATAATCY